MSLKPSKPLCNGTSRKRRCRRRTIQIHPNINCKSTRAHAWTSGPVGFRENAVEVDVLPHLTSEDLKRPELNRGHRRKLLNAISELYADDGRRRRDSHYQLTARPADASPFSRRLSKASLRRAKCRRSPEAKLLLAALATTSRPRSTMTALRKDRPFADGRANGSNRPQAEVQSVRTDLRLPTQSGPWGQARCVLSETAHSQSPAYARVPNSACASAISGICDVGAKPSSAGVRTAWASAGRLVAR